MFKVTVSFISRSAQSEPKRDDILPSLQDQGNHPRKGKEKFAEIILGCKTKARAESSLEANLILGHIKFYSFYNPRGKELANCTASASLKFIRRSQDTLAKRNIEDPM